MAIILASQSPRRRELLRLLYDDFKTASASINENIAKDEDVAVAAMSLAFQKAFAVAQAQTEKHLIIGADTVVSADAVFGKPRSAKEAKAMLRALAGRKHQVVSGVAIVESTTNRKCVFYHRTEVIMRPLDDAQIDAYIATGEPFDKAGGYGIQGYGALLVEAINGDYYTVMGLPVARLDDVLGRYFADYPTRLALGVSHAD
ncbi:MAG: septum formation protein Maf [Clostridiales bacterium]|nr:MAG: septum formation protein Maf [Clostridiales bacterium]